MFDVLLQNHSIEDCMVVGIVRSCECISSQSNYGKVVSANSSVALQFKMKQNGGEVRERLLIYLD